VTFAGRLEALIVIPSSLAISAQNSVGGPTVVTVTAGSYYWTSNLFYGDLATQLQTDLNAQRPSGWTVTFDATTRLVTINCTNTPWSITWTSVPFRNLLGFAANISSVSVAQTGTKQVRGLWAPNCPLDLEGDPRMAPIVTDLRAMRSPRGQVVSLVGNRYYRHRGLVWSAVPVDRYRAVAAVLNGETWEHFLHDTQIHQQLDSSSIQVASLFTPGSRVQIFDHTGGIVGDDFGLSGWFLQGLAELDCKKTTPGWSGLWRVEIPEIVSDG